MTSLATRAFDVPVLDHSQQVATVSHPIFHSEDMLGAGGAACGSVISSWSGQNWGIDQEAVLKLVLLYAKLLVGNLKIILETSAITSQLFSGNRK